MSALDKVRLRVGRLKKRRAVAGAVVLTPIAAAVAPYAQRGGEQDGLRGEHVEAVLARVVIILLVLVLVRATLGMQTR